MRSRPAPPLRPPVPHNVQLLAAPECHRSTSTPGQWQPNGACRSRTGPVRTSVDSFPRAFGLPMVVDGAAFPSTCGSMGSVRRAASFSRSSLDRAEPRPDPSAVRGPGHGLSGSNHHQRSLPGSAPVRTGTVALGRRREPGRHSRSPGTFHHPGSSEGGSSGTGLARRGCPPPRWSWHQAEPTATPLGPPSALGQTANGGIRRHACDWRRGEAPPAPKCRSVTGQRLRVSGYRFRATFRRRWGAYLSLVLLIGLVGGVAMGAIAPAPTRRT